MRLLAFALVLTLAACDSEVVDTSSFARLQGGIWERTDAGFADQTIEFGPRQAYVYGTNGIVVDQGDYFTRSSNEGEDVFDIGYIPIAGTRPDDSAVLSGDVLSLTADGSDVVRTYRRR